MSVDPDGFVYYYWKTLITVAVIYNTWVIILRTAFSEMRSEPLFDVLDCLFDFMFVFDMILEANTSFLSNGSLVSDSFKTIKNYTRKGSFWRDLIAISPIYFLVSMILKSFEILGLVNVWINQIIKIVPLYHPVFRLNRLLKCNSMNKYFQKTESRTNNPNFLRAFKLSLHLGLVIHWIACLYYMLSEYEGFGSTEWVYPQDTKKTSHFSKKYIFCMFWSTMTLTTIGERPPPETEIEYMFTGFTFLIGVFVFAAVVGNVGDVISNLHAARRDFQGRMDQIKFYMDHRNVPEHLQTRIKRWAEYTWDRTRAVDEPSALQFLPERLRTEVAIHVHLDTLKKVSIFDDCEEGLLRELVLKLKPQIFSPGDYICRMGEIGRCMYIINHGRVEILFPEERTGAMKQVAVMGPGNFFGEISLLKLDEGQNKRTADVRSVGFSELLCLSRRDLMTALTEYPEAKKVLEDYARERFMNTKSLAGCTQGEEAPPITPTAPSSLASVLSNSGKATGSARQVFARVMRQEGFTKLLAEKSSDMQEIKEVIRDMKDSRASVIEGSFEVLKQQSQLLGEVVNDQAGKLQEADAYIKRLERHVRRLSNNSYRLTNSYDDVHNQSQSSDDVRVVDSIKATRVQAHTQPLTSEVTSTGLPPLCSSFAAVRATFIEKSNSENKQFNGTKQNVELFKSRLIEQKQVTPTCVQQGHCLYKEPVRKISANQFDKKEMQLKTFKPTTSSPALNQIVLNDIYNFETNQSVKKPDERGGTRKSRYFKSAKTTNISGSESSTHSKGSSQAEAFSLITLPFLTSQPTRKTSLLKATDAWKNHKCNVDDCNSEPPLQGQSASTYPHDDVNRVPILRSSNVIDSSDRYVSPIVSEHLFTSSNCQLENSDQLGIDDNEQLTPKAIQQEPTLHKVTRTESNSDTNQKHSISNKELASEPTHCLQANTLSQSLGYNSFEDTKCISTESASTSSATPASPNKDHYSSIEEAFLNSLDIEALDDTDGYTENDLNLSLDDSLAHLSERSNSVNSLSSVSTDLSS